MEATSGELTTERLRAGLYRIYDEHGYLLVTIRKVERRTRPWIITYYGGVSGGGPSTLKAAKQLVEYRWNDNEGDPNA